jgi:G3E family GTPase
MEPIEIILITGFLGAGKTTLVNHLLRQGRFTQWETALVINEFGTMGIDGRLVEAGSRRQYEINKGSLFCICTKVEFMNTLAAIKRDVNPACVLVEATGMAETGDLEGILEEPVLAGHYRIAANLCVADGLNVSKVLPVMQAVRMQVECADGMIINKADLLTAEGLERVKELLAGINPRGRQIVVSHGQIPVDFLLGLKHQKSQRGQRENPPADVVSCSFATDQRVSRERFQEAVKQLGRKILRLKGNVNFEEGRRFVEIIYDQYLEREAVSGFTEATTFTVIGWKISREELEKIFFLRCLPAEG